MSHSSVSVALIIVAIAKNQNQATNIAPTIAVPLSFLVGSFFPLPDCVIATINSHQVQIYELLPWNQAITALRSLLTYGNGIESIIWNIILMLIMGLILLIISMILFDRKLANDL